MLFYQYSTQKILRLNKLEANGLGENKDYFVLHFNTYKFGEKSNFMIPFESFLEQLDNGFMKIIETPVEFYDTFLFDVPKKENNSFIAREKAEGFFTGQIQDFFISHFNVRTERNRIFFSLPKLNFELELGVIETASEFNTVEIAKMYYKFIEALINAEENAVLEPDFGVKIPMKNLYNSFESIFKGESEFELGNKGLMLGRLRIITFNDLMCTTNFIQNTIASTLCGMANYSFEKLV